MITSHDILTSKQRLTVIRDRLIGELAQVEQQKADLFHQGVAQSSQRLQVIIARQIRDLDHRAAGIDRSLQLIHMLNRLLGQLMFALENADRRDGALFARGDFDTMISSAEQSDGAQQQTLTQLDTTLHKLEQKRPVTPYPSQAHAPASARFLVRHIPDGDGLELEDGTRVRYIGIDAPEMRDWDGNREAFADEAKAFNAHLVLGQHVRLVRDTNDTDRYGRLLRYVYVGSKFVNAELVRAGLARAFDVWPDVKHAEQFLTLEREARQAQKGMWHQAGPTAPTTGA